MFILAGGCPWLGGGILREKTRTFGYRIVQTQLVFTAVVALLWLISGVENMMAALMGGLAVIVPNWIFAKIFLGQADSTDSARIVRVFYIGELIKLLISVLLMLILLLVLKAAVLPILTGFLAAHLGIFPMSIFRKADQ